MKKEILKLHADFCRVFSNPRRLEILCLLKSGELTVNEIAAKLGTSKAKAWVSDHPGLPGKSCSLSLLLFVTSSTLPKYHISVFLFLLY
jgi:DNA-binding transcriptional ArsR family regulator